LFVIAAVIATAVVLVRRQFRRAVSLACAAAAVPSLIFGQAHLAICSPYFWYVLTHETQLKAKASALAESQSPTFAVVETRDVSRGLAGLEGRLRAWRRFNVGGDAILKIERLPGQFYLVETTIR
jgi:hypothetical protein